MGLEKEQINLTRRRRLARWSNTRLKPTREHLDYLRKFLRHNKKLFLAAVSLLFIQGLAEIGLIVVSHQYLKADAKFSVLVNSRNLFLLIAVGALLYLLSSFIAVKSERTLIIKLINELRLKWFKLSLFQSAKERNLEAKGALLAKISYHLSLLSTGLGNSLAGAVRWFILILILVFLNFIFGWKFLWLSISAVAGSLAVAVGAFYISRNYVTRETTFFSRIIKLVDFTLSDWQFTKYFGRERETLADFNELVDFDSYFRVRRDLWLRFSGSLVFVILILLSWLVSLFNEPLLAFFATGADSRFILIIFLIYLSRLMYEGLRVGLYSVPFALGLILSVPEKSAGKISRRLEPPFQEIVFQLVKAKLFKRAAYQNNLNFCFHRGGRYLVSAAPRRGKSILARLFVGLGQYARRAWIIKADKKRFFYNDFFAAYSGFYNIDPGFASSRTILEVALGKEKTRIKEEEFIRLSALVNNHEELRDIFFERNDWRLRADRFANNAKNVLLLQVLYCLTRKPFLITVDNFWLDRGDTEIDALLCLLAKELPDSIIVFFAGAKRDLLPYDKSYEI